MKLLIISDTPHYRTASGSIVGWGPTIEEINWLSKLFAEVGHIGCLYSIAAPRSSCAYQSPNIYFIPVSAVGGRSFFAKISIFWQAFHWIRVILKELKRCDVVHVRCPANVSLVALLILACRRHPRIRWVKYAGDWQRKGGPWSYALQRLILHHNLHRGIVTINGVWPGQKKHEISLFNPSLTQKEIETAGEMIVKKELAAPYNLIFIGQLEENKRPKLAIEAASLQQALADFIQQHSMMDTVTFTGWLPHSEAKALLQWQDFLIMPSRSEGWPKVLSEAFAYGVFCIASSVSSIPQIVREGKTGVLLEQQPLEEIVACIERTIQKPAFWKQVITAAHLMAEQFTYEAYLERVKEILLR